MTIQYIWNRILNKLRGSAILNATIHCSAKVEAGSQFVNSTMGRYSYCGYNCKIINCNIGAFCSVADGTIIGGARHPMEWTSTSPVFYAGRDSVRKKFAEYERPEERITTIGNDVWIGDRTIIKAGVTIGNGAVIGMGSVVTKDVPPYEIWAGNPARMIRKRFDEETIRDLLASHWWDSPDSVLEEHAQHIRNPKEFLADL